MLIAVGGGWLDEFFQFSAGHLLGLNPKAIWVKIS